MNVAERARDARLRRCFHVTAKEYDAILARQCGGCAICGKVPAVGQNRLAVDHDHKTGWIRGLLCMSCNRGLPYYRDSPGRLIRAADYLTSPPAVPVVGQRCAPERKRKRKPGARRRRRIRATVVKPGRGCIST